MAGTGTPHLKWIGNGAFTGALPAEFAAAPAIDPDDSSARGALTTLKLGNSVGGEKKVRNRKRGKTALKVPLNATGRALLSGARNATLKVTVKATSRNTTRAKLRAKRTLAR